MKPGEKPENGTGKILKRRLNTFTAEGVVVLDAVTFPDDEERRARIFLKSGTSFDGIGLSSTVSPAVVRNFGGAPVVDCELISGQEGISVTAAGQHLTVTPTPAETELFAGLNVMLAIRNGETPDIAVDWLTYHVSQHGMDAALIFDRAPPGEDEDFAKALEERAEKIPGLKRVVIIRTDVPLGKAGLPGEAHPFNVPGAPGKDRMEIPPADPWRAPLGEFLIYEIARARFLSDARAVANIELHDLIAPTGGKNIFDQAIESRFGGIHLDGRQVYPWRVRPDQPATFADHICSQFDVGAERQRWCIAPAKTPEACIWRLLRVVGVTPDFDEGARFYRFMALRHPTDAVSKIVPKTSLIEDESLLALSVEYFSHNPVRMPEEQIERTEEKGAQPTTTIVTTMKNEGPFILEWLAYHRAIGVNNFLIYTNDCTDGTDTMLQMLQEKGIVQHRDNPFRESGLKPQHAALQAADNEPMVQASDWLVCMDVDEFINIKCGDGRLQDLFEAVGDANMISMTWRLFGNNDVHEFSGGLITEELYRCAHELSRKPHQAWGFKTLFRNSGIFKKLGVHRPKGLRPQLWESINWVNGSGKPLPREMFRNAWRSTTETYGYDLVQLNHYAVRSAESFLVKRDRGRVNHVDRDQGLSYWFRMNNNAEEERSIQRMLPLLRAEMDKLLADPDIAAAHAHSVQKHREKIDELKTRDDFLELYDELTGSRLERLSRMHLHFGANVFLSGPGVIPDEIVEKDPDDDFWFTVAQGETTH